MARASRRKATHRRPLPRKRPPGAPRVEIDLRRVAKLRRTGLDTVAEIARVMAVPKQTLLNAQHAEEVRAAMDEGRAQAKLDALQEYQRAIKRGNGNLTGLLIFKMKQFGWTDRVAADGEIEVNEGVRDRIREAVLKLQAKWKHEDRA